MDIGVAAAKAGFVSQLVHATFFDEHSLLLKSVIRAGDSKISAFAVGLPGHCGLVLACYFAPFLV